MENKIPFEPTLFICLGTSSAQIGWRLKASLRQAYGDVPILRFLWIDTDCNTEPAAAHWFTASERIDLSGFNGDEVLANLNRYPTIRAWWPNDSRLKPGYLRRGASQVRLYGRLALFRMFNDRVAGPAFIDRLRDSLEALQEIRNIDAAERLSTAQRRYVVERGSVRVVIFFSTCGGSGSGLSFDVAYLCRWLLRNSNPTVIAVALQPSVMDKGIKNETHTQLEKIRANHYAWLKENDALLLNPRWRVTYPEGAPVNLQAPPFDLTYVIDAGNQAGDRLNSQDDVFSMAAQAMFLDTGSSLGGALRGFNDNVSVLMEEFQGRRRAYSALAAASLVFPAEKILDYSAARFGQVLVRHGLLAEPEAGQVSGAAAALIGRLELRDDLLLARLMNGRQVTCLNGPAVRRAEAVETIRNLLGAQENLDSQERQRLARLMSDQAAELAGEARAALEEEVHSLARQRGLRFTQAVLQALIADPNAPDGVPEDTASLAGLKLRLAQQGVSEAEAGAAQNEYHAALQRLSGLSGEAWQTLWRFAARRSWQHELERARSDCLRWLAEWNTRSLQWTAQREAANLYDQLIESAHAQYANLAGLAQVAERAAERLETAAKEALNPSGQESGGGIYVLSIEAVDAAYIQACYEKRASGLDPASAYLELAGHLPDGSLLNCDEKELARLLRQHARTYFAEAVENTSLLQALADYHGEQAPARIEALFDRLVRYCHPFWQFDRDSGIQGQEGKSLIGVEDESSDLIPARYRSNIQYEIRSTGFKHRIDVARVQHGLPAFLLRGVPDCKAYYDVRRKGIDPLHILPEAANAAEVIPEEHQEDRRTFAVAGAFGFIVQIGSWYYFDPLKEYSQRRIHPGRENRLGQGRENAEEAFAANTDMARQAETLIESEVVGMGNRAAVCLLEERIDEVKALLSNMPLSGSIENGLRVQLEKELRALAEKQRQLGGPPPARPAAAAINGTGGSGEATRQAAGTVNAASLTPPGAAAGPDGSHRSN